MYHYCISRRDLSIGTLAAALVHAAGESTQLLNYPLPACTNAVALWVRDEQELKSLCATLLKGGVPIRPITESEGEHAGQLMAIGIKPCPKAYVKKYVSNIGLIREVRIAQLVEHEA